MTRFFSVSVLGNYKQYSTVYYRVYVPGDRGREPIPLASNYGPLAVLAANILNEAKLRGQAGLGGSEAYSFYKLVFTPVTLATVAERDDPPSVAELVTDPGGLACKILKAVAGKVEKAVQSYKNFIEKKGKPRAATVRLEVHGCDTSLVERNFLPALVEAEVSLAISPDDTNGSARELVFRGIVGIAVVPLTGAYGLEDGRMALFREATLDDVEVFGEALQASILGILYEAYRNALKRLREHSNDTSLTLIVDTTHGINNIVSVMVSVVNDVLELLHYEAARQGFSSFNALFYNSDPFARLGRKDEETLESTKDRNISYLYTTRQPQPIAAIADRADTLILQEAGLPDENMRRLLRGIYLLRRGVIPWALYMIETSEEPAEPPVRKLVSIEAKEGGNTVNVRLRVVERGKARTYYDTLLSTWLSSLVRDAVERLQELNELHKPGESGNICWEGTTVTAKCYSLDFIKLLVSKAAEKDVDTARYRWELSLLRRLMNDTARVIVDHEVKELKSRPLEKLQYIVKVQSLEQKISLKGDCDKLPGARSVRINGRTCYCITPTAEEKEKRNIIAHAGLTSATRLVGFIFCQKETSGKCEPIGVCIASDISEKFFRELVAELKD